MTDTADIPSPASEDALEPAAELVEWQMDILGELAEIGVRLARDLGREAAARAAAAEAALAAGEAAPPPRGRDLQLAFDRLTRSIRLTLILQTQVFQGEVVRLAQEAEARAQRARAAQEAADAAWIADRERVVLEAVERTLEADGQDHETIDDRLYEARQMFETDEDYDYGQLPIGVVIARLCKDFGVEPDWSVWADQDWAVEEAQDRPRGSPYARAPFSRAEADGPPDVDADADLSEPAGGSP